MIPRATYRLQLSGAFTFEQAAAVVPYLARLGVSHVYSSPILAARPGSSHGYDIVDHDRLNPELGGDAGFAVLSEALRRHGLRLMVDIVPNHMGIGTDNAWWQSLLAWGQEGPTAGFFDVDWQAGRLVVPILGKRYGQVLAAGEFVLRFERDTGWFALWYYDHRLPISPRQVAGLLEPAELASAAPAFDRLVDAFRLLGQDPRPGRELAPEADDLFRQLAGLVAAEPGVGDAIDGVCRQLTTDTGPDGALHRLIEAQAYRPAYWRVAAAEINYRRFFDINDLAGLRIEDPELFERVHRRILALVAEGRIHALRIDHVDGLADPEGYCRRLAERVGPDVPIYVEKILSGDERLARWPVAGTTGYDTLNLLNGLLVCRRAQAAFDRLYGRFLGDDIDVDSLVYDAKLGILGTSLRPELKVLGRQLKRIADADPMTRDFTLDGLTQGLAEVIGWFPVYRSYVADGRATEDDRRWIERATRRAQRRTAQSDKEAFDFIAEVLTQARGGTQAQAFATRFQQLTGPAMAKGLEDTACYRYTRLASLNEVGGDPRRFGIGVEPFHAAMIERSRDWPAAMTATATHDTKRGEDVRARLDVLSEIPAAWGARIVRWRRFNRALRWQDAEGVPAPSRNAEYLLYQTLVGSWPVELLDGAAAGPVLDAYADRVSAYMIKAAREAKRNTTWLDPDAEYEAALTTFVRKLLDPARPNPFLGDLVAFARRVATLGIVGSLTQTVAKLTMPGVPDLYQGTEAWDLSLVDPDNRRPVDFAGRAAGLDGGELPAALLPQWPDGRVKQRTIALLLRLRAERPDAFAGRYQPLALAGARAAHAVGFWRGNGDGVGIVLALHVARLAPGLPLGAAPWRDSVVTLPRPGRYRDLMGGAAVATDGDGRLPLATLLDRFPAAVLVAADQGL